ncbi:Putative Cytochrome C6 [Roseibacterium elongatum DSM 19469]|uniref:Putative Cytochrome C6 n=1 Tax=Roseicyclus elongatus DSM 19469 TaxID=1294273 RepID=W8S4G0_9RHOB|nr:cytochrome c [Roseibacterium elongatum]AHM05087.1 Putative Cytochrome C6 [Roseibacterium elongatum DSM 19469]
MTRFATTCTALTLAAALPVAAQDSEEGRHSETSGASADLGATTEGFLAEDGATLYRTACAGCHQPQGQGAVGAAAYPPLAANPRLAGFRYPTWILLNGQAAMPAFGDWLSDAQVVAVVSYIQQNFGNRYDATVTEADVAALRDAPAP